MPSLLDYATALVAGFGKHLQSGEVFAKVLTTNDDSGRHGVLVPNDAYAFFPDFGPADPTQNATITFPAVDVIASKRVTLAYKYYERYPERRITRLNGSINDRGHELRLIIFLRAKHHDGTEGYYVDCTNSATTGRFQELFQSIFGDQLKPEPGTFVMRPVDSGTFAPDSALTELLRQFDEVNARGWVDSLRTGDTGIGYTFETLLGIQENNDKRADYKGIEIKCKSIKENAAYARGKINLFQQGPIWALAAGQSARDRIRILGKADALGMFSCHSQITTTPNNLDLMLSIIAGKARIDLRKREDHLGHWPFAVLQHRLTEKHSRAVIIKAGTRSADKGSQFHFRELVYCERPSIERFLALVAKRSIVFEFLMSEKPDGSIRNHGYPWRLIREEFIDHLYTFQVKLR